jgi:hypothetical protein
LARRNTLPLFEAKPFQGICLARVSTKDVARPDNILRGDGAAAVCVCVCVHETIT